MRTLLAKIKKYFSRSAVESEPENSQELETLFKQRYHAFKLLLAANNKALESMTELDLALRGNTPFGMSLSVHATPLFAPLFSALSAILKCWLRKNTARQTRVHKNSKADRRSFCY